MCLPDNQGSPRDRGGTLIETAQAAHLTGHPNCRQAAIVVVAAETGADGLTVLADRGYFSGEEVVACEVAGITSIVPKPLTLGAKADGRFGKQDFVYQPETDTYRCPADEQLIWRYTTAEKGLTLSRYWSSNCGTCAMKAMCTPSKQRRITRWEHEAVIEAMQCRSSRLLISFLAGRTCSRPRAPSGSPRNGRGRSRPCAAAG